MKPMCANRNSPDLPELNAYFTNSTGVQTLLALLAKNSESWPVLERVTLELQAVVDAYTSELDVN
jgi:hypothetical protein